MSSRMRVTKGHTGNRRSHHGIKTPRLSKCSNCGAYHQRHRVCLECGFYKGQLVLDVKKVQIVEEQEVTKKTTKKPATKKVAKKETDKKKTVKKDEKKKIKSTKKTASKKTDKK